MSENVTRTVGRLPDDGDLKTPQADGQLDPGRPGEDGTPRARGIDDDVRLDEPVVGLEPADPPAGRGKAAS